MTTFSGSANAAPLAETQDCSAAAHARNDAVHLLHTAWKAFDGDLKDLARDARKLQHETEKASAVLTKDARSTVASARAELRDIASQAHSDIQGAADLGACSDESETTGTSTTTTTTATTTTTTTNSVTAPTDASPPADSSGSAHTFNTSGLDVKYKGFVDTAIADMQLVVDGARQAVLDIATAAESNETTAKDAEKIEQEVAKAKADRQSAKQTREDAKKADKAKASTKSQTSGKGGKGKAQDTNEDRD